MKDFILSEKVYRQLKSMISFLVPTRQGIKLEVNIDGGSFTDNERIVLGLPEIYHTRSREEMFSALFALVGHESQHINSSDFKRFKTFIKKVSQRFEDAGVPRYVGAEVAKAVMNGIEDGRIERILCHKMPGMLKHIKSLNSTFWMEQPVTMEMPKLQAFMYAIVMSATSGVYPRDFEKVHGDDETLDMLASIQPIIKRGVKGNHFHECETASYEVIDNIFDYVKNLFEESPLESKDLQMPELDFSNTEESESGSNQSLTTHFFEEDDTSDEETGGGQGSDDDNDKNEETSGDSDSKTSSSTSGDDQEESSKDDDSQKGQASGKGEKKEDKKGQDKTAGSDDKKEGDSSDDKKSDDETSSKEASSSDQKDKKTPTTEDVERLIQTKFQELKREAEEEAKKRMDGKKKKKEVEYDTVLTPEEIRELEQMSLIGSANYRDRNLRRSATTLPPSVKRKGTRLHKELENLFRNKTAVNLHGQRRGKLHASDLYRLKAKDYHVFTKQGTPVTTDYVAFILQDGSGSMEGRKYHEAMEAQMIIEEGLKGLIPFKSMIYNGSSDDNQLVFHYPIKNWNDTSKTRNYASEAFKAYSPMNANQDGASIRYATKELLKRPEKDRLLFVLSDGLPYLRGDMKLGVKDTKEAVKEARAQGIHVILIAFGHKSFREEHIDNYRTMYQRNIISCEPSMIMNQLSKQLKNILKR